MADPTLIDPYKSSKYTFPFNSARPTDERKKNIKGYTYDLILPELGDKFSFLNGYYELRLNEEKYSFLYDSQNKWTGYTILFEIRDKNNTVIIPKKPTGLIFLNGVYSIKLPKNQKGKFGYIFTLIDNTYPKYLFEPTTNPTVTATVIDSKTGKPIKAKVN
jgi:hypothetical protein